MIYIASVCEIFEARQDYCSWLALAIQYIITSCTKWLASKHLATCTHTQRICFFLRHISYRVKTVSLLKMFSVHLFNSLTSQLATPAHSATLPKKCTTKSYRGSHWLVAWRLCWSMSNESTPCSFRAGRGCRVKDVGCIDPFAMGAAIRVFSFPV